jgi:hypothetical protein
VEQRLNLFRRAFAVAAMALIASTFTLWTPQALFPQAPAVEALGQLPEAIDWIALVAMVLALAAVLLVPQQNNLWRQGLVVFVVALTLLILIDQHRFQPWAYEFLLIALVLANARSDAALTLLRWLVIGIYVWSAWSKCDVTFTVTLGQQFLNALLGWAGFDEWPETARRVFASLFPVGELAVAVLLAIPRSRKWGLGASVALHLLLLAALGPLGLQHKPGVLLWNVWFIVQNVLLFWPVEAAAVDEKQLPKDGSLPAAALYVVAVAVVWPVVETWQYCDHWPAWSVYAPRVERTSFFVHRSEQGQLPESLHAFLEPSSDDANWLRLRLDHWSLEMLDTPLYPQNRLQIAVAEAVARQYGLTQARAVRYSTADRLTRERSHKTADGLGQLADAVNDYVLGARAVRKLRFGKSEFPVK